MAEQLLAVKPIDVVKRERDEALARLRQLSIENAQLAAALHRIREIEDSAHFKDGGYGLALHECAKVASDASNGAALAALLAPTIELLTAYPTSIHEYDSEYSRKVMEELARLRAVKGNKP